MIDFQSSATALRPRPSGTSENSRQHARVLLAGSIVPNQPKVSQGRQKPSLALPTSGFWLPLPIRPWPLREKSVFIGVHPWLKNTNLPNEPISKNSEILANQPETQKCRVSLAQKRTQNSGAGHAKRLIQSISKGFKAIQRFLRKKMLIFAPGIPWCLCDLVVKHLCFICAHLWPKSLCLLNFNRHS
jgi:hypothetical protein